MKKPRVPLLAVLTLAFAVFTVSFFLVRNRRHGDVLLSVPGTDTAVAAFPEDGPSRIDLNTATFEELVSLPGIGEVLARRILEYRDRSGGFQRAEELLNVEGIGAQRLELIWEYICIGG